MSEVESRFVLGLDLDGTCADFYGRMREIAAEWTGRPLAELPEDADWNLDSWGIGRQNYGDLHRFAVTERDLFSTMKPLPGAPQALRRLSKAGIRIRIITHRLFIHYSHEMAVSQTVRWLDSHGVPYWDLCFMADKDEVGADLYIEDSPSNIETLRDAGKEVLVFGNSTNRHALGARVENWTDAEQAILNRFETRNSA